MVGIASTTNRPPITWKTWEFAGQSRSASHPIRGDTLAGSSTSNTAASSGGRSRSPAPGVDIASRVRAEGETTFDRTPYPPASIATVCDRATTASFALA